MYCIVFKTHHLYTLIGTLIGTAKYTYVYITFIHIHTPISIYKIYTINPYIHYIPIPTPISPYILYTIVGPDSWFSSLWILYINNTTPNILALLYSSHSDSDPIPLPLGLPLVLIG